MPLVKLAGSALLLGVAALAAGCVASPSARPSRWLRRPSSSPGSRLVVAPRPYVVAPAYRCTVTTSLRLLAALIDEGAHRHGRDDAATRRHRGGGAAVAQRVRCTGPVRPRPWRP